MIRGLYVHIPFCKSKCPYCDFNSYAGKTELADEYIEALLREAREFEKSEICTVYLGGGTPSCLSAEQTKRLMAGLYEIFDVAKDAEITTEANPGTVDEEKLAAYRSCGINRLSLGVQSFDKAVLKTLGRIHSPENAKNAVFSAKKAGFENISVDLMFSIPGQTVQSVENDVKEAVKLDVSHVSCYGLKIEPGTVFHKKGVKCLDDETDRKMYEIIKRNLENSGYMRYEISNFAKEGMESRHNLLYWHCDEYIGLGCGAHSYVNGRRYSNIKNIGEYIKCAVREDVCVIEERDKLVEKLIMGMRLKEGVPYSLAKSLGSEKTVEKYIRGGFIICENNKIKFTDRGFDVSNYILSELI